jgi:hypothetical protein
MIGSVSIAGATVSLGDDGEFMTSGGEDVVRRHLLGVAAYVKQRFPYGGPADGPFGVRWLHEIALRTGGAVHFEPKAPAPAGTVY